MPRLKLIVAWLLVGIPLAWGVFHSVKRSLPLFRGSPQVAPAAAPIPSR